MPALVEFSNVGFQYAAPAGSGDATVVFDSFSLVVNEGDRVAIMGPSGCGKSTLLKLALQILEPTTGTVVRSRESHCGVVFQHPLLLPWLSVLRNVSLPLELAGGDLKAALPKAKAVLESVKLADVCNHSPHELSQGMQHRSAIARALVVGPDLCVMDEPFANLDLVLRAEMRALVRTVLEDAGLMLVTHDADDAFHLAQRVLIVGGRPARILREIQLKESASADENDAARLHFHRELHDVLCKEADPAPSVAS